jgi:hypothetical protein
MSQSRDPEQPDFSFEDSMLRCRDCGISFVFTRNEQRTYAERGYRNAPSRCPACRYAHRKLGRRRGSRRSRRKRS